MELTSPYIFRLTLYIIQLKTNPYAFSNIYFRYNYLRPYMPILVIAKKQEDNN